MNEGPATLELPDDNGAPPATVAGPAHRGGGMKFSYASGAKPLDGYTIKRGVGIGGFGEVYFAVTDAGKEVALKRVQRNLEIELRGVSQCLNLKHVNLVDLYDIRYDDQGGAWVVMEFITGESLKDVIDRNPNGLPKDELAHWLLGICEGVAYLHDQGIVHRDLKPGNIFNDQGVVKIGDYGLAKFISSSRRSGQTESVGTFHYMAPEIGKGSYGKEVDIYALGVILYEMLTGRVPFDGESSQEIIMRHLTEDVDVQKLAPPYRSVVARALQKDPELRYTSVRDMIDELGGILRPGIQAVVTATVVRPPIHRPSDVLYIGDEPPARDMQFGPVKQRRPVPGARAVAANKTLYPVTAVPATQPGEPIGQAVSRGAESVTSWWQGSTLSTGLKVGIVVLLLAAAIFNVKWLLPLGIGIGLMYAIFAGIWLLVQSLSAPAVPASGIRFRSWQELVRENLRSKSAGMRLGELTGGWVAAAILCGLLSFALVAAADSLQPDVETMTLYTWLAISSTFGSWAVLAVGKFCEGLESDAVRRRVVMLALGLAAGAAAWGLEQSLLLDIANVQHSVDASVGVSAATTPDLARFVVFFAALLATPAWWKQTDPLRRTRVNLISLIGCVLWSGIISVVWPFPQPWGFMLAGTISLASQLAAPWMTPAERDAAKREFRRV
jgi:hypothetical protein